MDDRSIDQPQESAAAAPLPAAPTSEARRAATLAASSMPVNTADGHQLAYTAFCANWGLPSASPLLQLLPPGPAVQTHVTVAPLDRKDWLHQFRDGLHLPGGGLSLAPVPTDWQRVAPAGRPCPGVSQDAADGKIWASDTISRFSTFHAMTPQGSGPAASSRPNTSGRKLSTDAQGWVANIWSRGWCAPLDHFTVAPLPVPCSPCRAACRQLRVHAASGRCKGRS